ncbi:MAG: 50S ribosomal protein L11 methyltransferase [Pseudomonadota bacterium]|nr:50S ribosomal protein L11 methyltransferase [Pseudomonadota bacterium]
MIELTLLATAASVEAVSDLLIETHGALSVSVEDADAGTASERALFGEPGMAPVDAGWNRSVVKALFDDISEARAAATQVLADAVGNDALQLQSIQPIADQDWVRLTQAQFTPTEIGPDFWVVPTWHEPPAAAQRIIRLDPGMAFGTGTHPTTRMCLRWIAHRAAQRAPAWTRALDYGCGSGILAIGAALHGARHIDAIDIDPQAVTATAANAQANGIALHAGLPESASGLYALVLANILSTPLKLLAPLLCSHLAPGGDLVLAGILERQAGEIAVAYAPWLTLDVSDSADGWVLMTGQLPSRVA